MEGGRSNFPAALMHLFYYQQGLFAEEETSSTWNLLGQVVSPTTPPRQPVESPGVEEIQLPRGESAEAGAAAEEPEDRESRLRSLRTRRAELESKLQAGALRAENEVLEDRVMRAQEDFLGLQAEFKAMKEQHNERLDSLRLALEEQQKDAEQADRRVVCAEDLVRFHQEQRRMMASHWKQQCQMKDERIRYLNLQLTEYTIDWQQLGVQRQTEASLSHEHYCLEDRHRHLLQTQRNLTAETSRLESCLQQANTEEARLTEALRLAEVNLGEGCPQSPGSEETAADVAEPRVQRWKELVEAPKSHRCIWRDELDVRESQLEKITAQLERTDTALRSAQVALATQRAKHQEMKTRHGDAESKLRESERLRVQSQRRCQELGRAEAAMLRLLEAVEAHGPNTPSGPSTPQTQPSLSLPD